MEDLVSGAQLAAEVNEATSLTAALAYARLGWPVLPVAGMSAVPADAELEAVALTRRSTP